jgi:hypothetical protein
MSCVGLAVAYLLDAAGVWNVAVEVGGNALAAGMLLVGATELAHHALRARRGRARRAAGSGSGD